MWPRADTVVWLDLPRAMIIGQVVTRTLARVALRRTLWSGSRERWRDVLTLDPEKSVIMWSWHQHGRKRLQYRAAMSDPTWSHLRFVRLTSRRETAAFVRSLARPTRNDTKIGPPGP